MGAMATTIAVSYSCSKDETAPPPPAPAWVKDSLACGKKQHADTLYTWNAAQHKCIATYLAKGVNQDSINCVNSGTSEWVNGQCKPKTQGVNQDSINCVNSGTSEWVNGQCKPITQSNALRTSLDSVTNIPQAGSTYNIDVASSLAWTAATTQSWVTVSPTMANGNSPITLTVQAYNAYDTVRTASLRFTAGGAVVRTLKIEQRGGVCGVTQVTLSQTTLAIQKGYPDYSTNAALTATALPADAALKTLTWSSSNTATASIDQSGNITALAAGTTTITARAVNGKQASCALTVDQANVPWLQDSLDCKTPVAGYKKSWNTSTHQCTSEDNTLICTELNEKLAANADSNNYRITTTANNFNALVAGLKIDYNNNLADELSSHARYLGRSLEYVDSVYCIYWAVERTYYELSQLTDDDLTWAPGSVAAQLALLDNIMKSNSAAYRNAIRNRNAILARKAAESCY
ncbi:hypothetical protein FACS1894195_1620 [Bacteroidia bacterium]|nr:hypothetical protein FACS1894195_1620 [Bacteroidia bacterium]